MKKPYRTLQFYLIFFFILALSSQALAKLNLTKLVKKIQPAVVTVITYDIDKKVLLQGTGFFVDKKGHLITNYHVLKGGYAAEVKTYDGKKYPIKLVIAQNRHLDLIKVSVDIPKKSIHWVKIIKSMPDIAERVIVVGSPMGLEQTVSEGIVSAIRKIPKVGEIFQISAPISSGSSGSPVVNINGEIIGVATFQFVKGQNLNFAVPSKYVLDLKTGKTISEWTYGINRGKLEEDALPQSVEAEESPKDELDLALEKLKKRENAKKSAKHALVRKFKQLFEDIKKFEKIKNSDLDEPTKLAAWGALKKKYSEWATGLDFGDSCSILTSALADNRVLDLTTFFDMGNKRLSIKRDPADLKGSFVDSKKEGKLFVVKGLITNNYSDKRKFIRIRSNILDSKGKVVKSKTVYAGNPISDMELLSLSMVEIDNRLMNKFGKDNVNTNISPNASIPFMIIFSDLPEDISEFTVESISSFLGEEWCKNRLISIPNLRAIPEGVKTNENRGYNMLAKADLRNACTAQEAYFVDNQRYAISIDKLIGYMYGLYLNKGVTVSVIAADENEYIMKGFHSKGDKAYIVSGPGGTILEQ